MPSTFVVHYAEVALKGKNRPEFVRLLRRNLHRSLRPLKSTVSARQGRLLVVSEGATSEVEEKISRVFGVAWFSQVSVTKPDYESIAGVILSEAASSDAGTFKIDARRGDKTYPLSSQELASRLGADVVAATGKKVDLSRPELTLYADISGSQAFVYSSRRKGPGGLPVGSAGKSVHLFSGGIDSSPAAWLMMKRGSRLVYLHFYLAPTPQYPISSKVPRLVSVLSEYGGKSTLVLVPFAEYQAATIDAPPELEPSLFRRFMRITAEAVAPFFGASAISTGDSLSQAASQTIWNLGSFDRGSSLPILRPLLTYDKEEVVSLAKRIGTYESSLEEYRDCCAIVTRHPRTRTAPDVIDGLAAKYGFQNLAQRTLEQATMLILDPGAATKVMSLKEAMTRTQKPAEGPRPVLAGPPS